MKPPAIVSFGDMWSTNELTVDIDVLMPNGILISLHVDKELTLLELKEVMSVSILENKLSPCDFNKWGMHLYFFPLGRLRRSRKATTFRRPQGQAELHADMQQLPFDHFRRAERWRIASLWRLSLSWTLPVWYLDTKSYSYTKSKSTVFSGT